MWSKEDFERPFGLQTCLRALARIIYVVTDDPEGYVAGFTEWLKAKRWVCLWVNDGEQRVEKQQNRWTGGRRTLDTTAANLSEILWFDPKDGNHIELVTDPARWFANPEWVGMFALHTDADDRRMQSIFFLGPETEIPVSLQPLVMRVGPPLDNPRYGADLFSETCVEALQAAYRENASCDEKHLAWCVKRTADHAEKAQKPDAIYTDLTVFLNKLKTVIDEVQVQKAAEALQGYSLFQVREILAMAITLNRKPWKPQRNKSFEQPWKKRAREDLAGLLAETVEAITQHYGWPS